MRLALQGGIACIVLAICAVLLVPEESAAGLFSRKKGCRRCKRAPDCCVCPQGCLMADPCAPVMACPAPACPIPCPPAVTTETTLRPVVETQYVQQPVLTTRNVQQTCYRPERYLETAPATVFDCVTVDEGCYQMVWVPKPVQKQVARTVYQQRLACRTVPYTVNRQVTECTTQTVPVQTVRYVPETRHIPCPPAVTPICPPYGTIPYSSPGFVPGAVTPGPTFQNSVPAPTPATPATPAPAGPSTEVVPHPRPTPVSAFPNSLGQPTPVAPRLQSYALPATDQSAIAPSAAAVWRTTRTAR